MGETFVLKLNDGADIMQGIEKLVKDKNIDYCSLVSGTGRLRDIEMISNESSAGISRVKLGGEFGLYAISGKIQKSHSGQFNTNIRVSVTTRSGFSPKSGQLVNGKASGVLELSIRQMDVKKIIEK